MAQGFCAGVLGSPLASVQALYLPVVLMLNSHIVICPLQCFFELLSECSEEGPCTVLVGI